MWLSQLPSLHGVSLGRCFKLPKFDTVRVELHCLCDASEVGYGAVGYLRIVSAQKEVNCYLCWESQKWPLKVHNHTAFGAYCCGGIRATSQLHFARAPIRSTFC